METKPAQQRKASSFVIIGNIIFAAGIAATIYTLAKIFLLTRGLPPGACPLTTAGAWPYVAITLLLVSLILSFFEKKEPVKK